MPSTTAKPHSISATSSTAAAAAKAALCCTHPQSRIDSPEPPSRLPSIIDSIFAEAALPEGHPHAFDFGPLMLDNDKQDGHGVERRGGGDGGEEAVIVEVVGREKKVDVDVSRIVRSPGVARKVRAQFVLPGWLRGGRGGKGKACGGEGRGLEKERGCGDEEEDARLLESREVVRLLGGEGEEGDEAGVDMDPARFGSVRIDNFADPIDDAPASSRDGSKRQTTGVRTSVLGSLEWLRPLLQQKTSRYSIAAAKEPKASPVASNDRQIIDPPQPCPFKLPQSSSSPQLLRTDQHPIRPLRRTQSSFALKDIDLASQAARCSEDSDTSSTTLRAIDVPAIAIQLPALDLDHSGLHMSFDTSNPDLTRQNTSKSRQSDRVHLHTMDIPQHLRSLSPQSEYIDTEDSLAPETWTFHRREHSDLSVFKAGVGSHLRCGSVAVVREAEVARVKSPAVSSMYSRPCSAFDEGGFDGAGHDIYQTAGEYVDLAGRAPDWPLMAPVFCNGGIPVYKEEHLDSVKHTGDSKAPTSTNSAQRSSKTSLATATPTNNNNPSVSWLSPPDEATSQRSASSTRTKRSISTKLFKHLSPPKKGVRARFSIFRLLRAGGRRQLQSRSISTPILNATRSRGHYDGPADDSSLLTIQYELPEMPRRPERAASMGNLEPNHANASSLLAPPTIGLQRRPSLADYERSLTAGGDDRRRPSAVDLQTLYEAQSPAIEAPPPQPIRKRLSRARALDVNDDNTGLMAQALEKHQQEKALFRSASKQKERGALLHDDHTQDDLPSFSGSSFSARPGRSRSSLVPPEQEHEEDLLDPLDITITPASSSRRPSIAPLTSPHPHLLEIPPGITALRNSSRRASSAAITTTASSLQHTDDPAPRSSSTKIGTALASWSRYPSHTRPERCTSATPQDAVISRDFAIDIDVNHDEIVVHPSEADDNDANDNKNPRTLPLPTSAGMKSTKTTQFASSNTAHSSSPPHHHRPPHNQHLHALPKSRSTTFSTIVKFYSHLFTTTAGGGSATTTRNRRTSVATGGWLENPDLEIVPHGAAGASAGEGMGSGDRGLRESLRELEERMEFEEKKGGVEEGGDDGGNAVEGGKGSGRTSPFRQGSIFTKGQGRVERGPSVVVGPMEDDEHDHGPRAPAGDESGKGEDDRGEASPRGVMPTIIAALDGTGDVADADNTLTPPSKAAAWSAVYQECVLQPTSTETPRVSCDEHQQQQHLDEAQPPQPPTLNNKELIDRALMPPPSSLHPIKPRSPEQPRQTALDKANPTVRRCPSVTVIDDRKGHARSVSLISVKVTRHGSNGSNGRGGEFVRSSTNDLLEMVERREVEEREKLMGNVVF